MTRISAKLREEAAQICSMVASDADDEWDFTLDDLGTRDAVDLVDAATTESWLNGAFRCDEIYAEAECLLRCGWSPK